MSLPTSPPSRRFERLLLALTSVAWVATLAVLVRSEILSGSVSADVRELVDDAGLAKAHSSAGYAVRVAGASVGTLRSEVSGSKAEGQLIYGVSGELRQPFPVQLRGFVLASWEREPKRFVFEVTWAGEQHRVEGRVVREPSGGDRVEVELHPAGGPHRRESWELASAMRLADVPVPLPASAEDGPPGPRSGTIAHPLTGEPVEWSLEWGAKEDVTIAGRSRPSRRHVLRHGGFESTLWMSPEGLPLRLELPLGLVVELLEDS